MAITELIKKLRKDRYEKGIHLKLREDLWNVMVQNESIGFYEVSKRCGISYNTLLGFMESKKPQRALTIEKLSKFVYSQDKKTFPST